MDSKEKEQIDLWKATHLEDRVKVRSTNFNFELWAIKISEKNDADVGKMFREYVTLCMGRQPEKVDPETFASSQALKGLAKSNQARVKQTERIAHRWGSESSKGATTKKGKSKKGDN